MPLAVTIRAKGDHIFDHVKATPAEGQDVVYFQKRPSCWRQKWSSKSEIPAAPSSAALSLLPHKRRTHVPQNLGHTSPRGTCSLYRGFGPVHLVCRQIINSQSDAAMLAWLKAYDLDFWQISAQVPLQIVGGQPDVSPNNWHTCQLHRQTNHRFLVPRLIVPRINDIATA
jgi:hypothetical protein